MEPRFIRPRPVDPSVYVTRSTFGRIGVHLLFGLVCLLVSTSGGAAQETSTITGTVLGPEGDEISAATVHLAGPSEAAQRTDRTDAVGRYEFVGVPPGDYTLSLTAPRYREESVRVSVDTAGTYVVDFDLQRLYALQQVVVTATREEQDLGSISSAVSVVGSDAIQRGRKGINLEESLRRVPGVRIEDELGGTAHRNRIIIRGVGTRANNAAGSGVRGVKVLVDGIPKNNAGGSAQDLVAIDMNSVDRIEVLKGPSSALYGNQSGGVVNIITETGPPETFFEYKQTVGSYGLFQEHAEVGGQTGNLSYHASAWRTDQDGYRDRSRFSRTGFHSKLVLAVGDETSVTTTLAYDNNHEESPGPLTREQFEEDPTQNNPNFAQTFSVVEEFRLGIRVNHQGVFGDEDAVDLTGYYIPRRLGPFRRLVARIPQDFTNRGANLRYVNSGDLGGLEHRFTTGVDFQNTPITTGVFSPETGATFAALEEEGTTVGIYAQDELTLTPGLVATVAGRFDFIDFSSRDNTQPGSADSRTFEEFTLKGGLAWEPIREVSVYGNFSEGFEAPIIGELRIRPGGEFGFNQQLGPQRSENYEVGARGSLWGDRVVFETALYRQVIDDFISPFGETPRSSFQNIAEVDQVGFEFGSDIGLTETLTLGLSYTYSDFTFEEFQDIENDFSGNELPGVPEHSFFGDLRYRTTTGFHAAAEVKAVDEFFVDNANTAVNDAYTVVNLRLGHDGLEAGAATLGPYLGIGNLFDETYSAFAFINAQDGAYFNPLPETNVFGGVTVRF